MYYPLSLFIGIRYIYRSTSDFFNFFVSSLSVIGIALGVIALTVALSIMNGFEKKFTNNILKFVPHILIVDNKNRSYIDHDLISTFNLKDVRYIAPVITTEVILQSAKHVSTGLMIGIQLKNNQNFPYFSKILSKKLIKNQYNVIFGKHLSSLLNIKKNDKIRIIIPSIQNFSPIGRIPSQRFFNVVGIYGSKNETENNQIFVNIKDALNILHLHKGVKKSWRVWLNNPLKISDVLKKTVPNDLVWTDWREIKGDLFHAIKMEKNIMGLLLSLIIITASFNVLTSLGLIIIDKKREVAVLKTLGMNNTNIMLIFMIIGMIIGILGTSLGICLGLLITYYLTYFFPFTKFILNSDSAIINISVLQIVIIITISMIVTLLSTLYPSWYATKIQPAKALRYE
ncbi:FtsX-like permease family protein [Candidatus Tachikawaea gelatinosa]|uniref:Lipoprotein-releasing system transmembrane protein LolC n=1 Tax=Candidatus Tachikawaea gelatinosa TaxID=1410383 RepID=A0A090AQ56_9ENTR|nr:FtsX-like permease family protein [Candidatus Tachikawaea gelatinosa]BAP58477.1 lipoprotein-releasing system transmembrane protein LolC [Candidatus Tachikawaea gelatinosa]